MARKSLQEPRIDTVLTHAYAKTDRLHDMEDFLSMTNAADVLEVGERCFPGEIYQAAKSLFSFSNVALLATTFIYLGESQATVESARKPEIGSELFHILSPRWCQGMKAGARRMYWEESILTYELTIDPIVLDLTSLSLGIYMWSEYHSPCHMYLRSPDASIR